MSVNATTHMLTLDEVAAELGVVKSTVEVWVYEEKSLDSFKKGKVRKVSEENLTKFVLANTLRAKRPDWLTADVESKFWQKLRETMQPMIAAEMRRLLPTERIAA